MFTIDEFNTNEDNNYHTENGIELAKQYGTQEEIDMMLKIQHAHYARGHIQPDEVEARAAIVSKYYPHLEEEIPGKPKESRASGAPYKAITEISDEAPEKGAEYYQEKDKQNTDHVKAELEELMSHLDQAITYRYQNSHLMLNSGNKAGTGEMYRMADKLKELHTGWDEATELYGM
mgnify:FL=1